MSLSKTKRWLLAVCVFGSMWVGTFAHSFFGTSTPQGLVANAMGYGVLTAGIIYLLTNRKKDKE